MTRTTIGSISHHYAALGVTREGNLYGVASDGNLYKIDNATAKETLIGSTGIKLEDALENFYGQTGEIDQSTNTFYWAAVNMEGASALYTVNLETAAVTKIADFANRDQFYGMVIPPAQAADGAPAAADSIGVDFPGGATSGSITFEAPVKTYGGGDLDASKELTYKVYVNGAEKAEGTALPGDRIVTQLENLAEGSNRFMVIFSNSEGDGAKTAKEVYIGFDTPKPATDVKLTIDKDAAKATISWTAPEEGVNGGYVGNLTYNVVRYPDGTKVATAITDTSLTDYLSKDKYELYSYGVTVVSNGKASDEAKSNTMLFGNAISVPYTETFDTESAFNTFTVDDANTDGDTWTYSSRVKSALYEFSKDNKADDWLITPPIKLEKNKIYTVSFDANSGIASYPERMEVMYGTGAEPAKLTQTLMPATVLPRAVTTYSYDIVMTEDDNVNFGFHAISDANMYQLTLDNIKVSEGRPAVVPGVPSGLKVEAGADGALEANVTLTAPAQDVAGGALTENLTRLELLRGDSVVKTFTNVAPGATLTFKDVYTKFGNGTYTAVAYNANGQGQDHRTCNGVCGRRCARNA